MQVSDQGALHSTITHKTEVMADGIVRVEERMPWRQMPTATNVAWLTSTAAA